jgi:uncharacterized membrane protein YeaQ/YmgE (transglycosylase-associated protein family)
MPEKLIDGIPSKFVGIPTEYIFLGLVIAVVGAVILPFIKLGTYLPGQSKWVYGGIWFVIGAAVVIFGSSARGIWGSILMGTGIAFFIAAFLQWGGWSYSK